MTTVHDSTWRGRRGATAVIAAAPLAAAVLLPATTANAQHADDYESSNYTATPEGTPIFLQPDGDPNPYYIPVVGSQDSLVYTYVDNVLGVPPNPGGGNVFVGSTGIDPGPPEPFVRSQRDVPYVIPGGRVKLAYDVLVTKIGDPVTEQNVGSLSTQLVVGGSDFGHIDLFTWIDPDDATLGWNAEMVWFSANATVMQTRVLTGFVNDRWYRRSNAFDLDTNEILKLVVTDKTTDEARTFDVFDRYAAGGDGPGTVPAGFRYFAGCSIDTCTGGNTLAWDNILITCYEDIDEDRAVGFSDILRILTAWGPCPDGCPEDLDRDGMVGFSDILEVLSRWGPCL